MMLILCGGAATFDSLFASYRGTVPMVTATDRSVLFHPTGTRSY